jgi:hypothetical protein
VRTAPGLLTRAVGDRFPVGHRPVEIKRKTMRVLDATLMRVDPHPAGGADEYGSKFDEERSIGSSQ